jgi:hypothetical protein
MKPKEYSGYSGVCLGGPLEGGSLTHRAPYYLYAHHLDEHRYNGFEFDDDFGSVEPIATYRTTRYEYKPMMSDGKEYGFWVHESVPEDWLGYLVERLRLLPVVRYMMREKSRRSVIWLDD